jgi:Smg protein
MLEVLLYLFENYIKYNAEMLTDMGSITVELENAGFSEADIDRAFTWLEGLISLPPADESKPEYSLAVRHFTAEECLKIPADCRGYLLFLDQSAVISPAVREIVIDRTMALEVEKITVERLKWVLLLVLFSEPSGQPSLNLMQELVFRKASDVIH